MPSCLIWSADLGPVVQSVIDLVKLFRVIRPSSNMFLKSNIISFAFDKGIY